MVALARIGQAHGVFAGLLQEGQATADGAQGGGVGDSEEVAQALRRRVVPQPDDGEQHLVGRGQIEVVAAAESALAAFAVQALPALGGKGGEEVREHVVEEFDGQAGHGPEDGRMLAQVLALQDHEETPIAAAMQL